MARAQTRTLRAPARTGQQRPYPRNPWQPAAAGVAGTLLLLALFCSGASLAVSRQTQNSVAQLQEQLAAYAVQETAVSAEPGSESYAAADEQAPEIVQVPDAESEQANAAAQEPKPVQATPKPTPQPTEKPAVQPAAVQQPASAPQAETSAVQEQQVTVYVTKTGECYHSSDCQYLRSSKIAVSLEYAKKLYRRCSRCHAPA